MSIKLKISILVSVIWFLIGVLLSNQGHSFDINFFIISTLFPLILLWGFFSIREVFTKKAILIIVGVFSFVLLSSLAVLILEKNSSNSNLTIDDDLFYDSVFPEVLSIEGIRVGDSLKDTLYKNGDLKKQKNSSKESEYRNDRLSVYPDGELVKLVSYECNKYDFHSVLENLKCNQSSKEIFLHFGYKNFKEYCMKDELSFRMLIHSKSNIFIIMQNDKSYIISIADRDHLDSLVKDGKVLDCKST